MYEIGDIVDVYQALGPGRKTAFLFTGPILKVDITNSLHYIEPSNPTHKMPGTWAPLWALVLVKSSSEMKQNKIEAYERAMKIL